MVMTSFPLSKPLFTTRSAKILFQGWTRPSFSMPWRVWETQLGLSGLGEREEGAEVGSGLVSWEGAICGVGVRVECARGIEGWGITAMSWR